MKPKSLSIALIVLFMVYGYYARLNVAQPAAQVATTAPATNTSSTPATSSTTTSTPTPAQSTRRGEDDASSAVTQRTTTQATPTPTPKVTPAPTPTPVANTGQYKNGTYTGAVADAFYGNVQVSVTISGGKLTDVTFLQSPGDRQTSRSINSQAMPMLKQQAISAQSAQVNGVSGASATSQAFVQSLGDALAQAKV